MMSVILNRSKGFISFTEIVIIAAILAILAAIFIPISKHKDSPGLESGFTEDCITPKRFVQDVYPDVTIQKVNTLANNHYDVYYQNPNRTYDSLSLVCRCNTCKITK